MRRLGIAERITLTSRSPRSRLRKRHPCALLVVVVMVAVSLPVSAQDPFQSVPAPAPVVRSPPAPAPRAQAPRPRPVFRDEPEPEPVAVPPPLTSMAPRPSTPPVAAPQPPPAPAEPPTLAGKWMGSSNCPFASPQWEIHLAPLAREQYSITEPQNSSLTGWVSGKLVRMQWVGRLGETITADGTLTSPTAMGGKRYMLLGVTCDWWAGKK